MQLTFSGVLKKSGNSTYILIPANILDVAGIDPDESIFSATIDKVPTPEDGHVVEMVVRIWTKSEATTKKAAEDAPTA